MDEVQFQSRLNCIIEELEQLKLIVKELEEKFNERTTN
jgi:hypothetical protein